MFVFVDGVVVVVVVVTGLVLSVFTNFFVEWHDASNNIKSKVNSEK